LKLIVISPFVYYPGVPHGGGALCWGQLEGLARAHEIHFVAFAQEGSAELAAALPHLSRLCASVTTVHQPLDKLTILRAKLALVFKRIPVGVSICQSVAMQQHIAQAVARVAPDAVLVQFPQMAQYVAACGSVHSVMDVQDAYSVSTFRQYKAQPTGIKKALAFLNWLGWVQHESRWYPQFSKVAAITEQDRLGLEVFTPGLNAVTSPAAVPLPQQVWAPTIEAKIAFIGSFSHPPNQAALAYFLGQVFPLVQKQMPGVVFEVAGKGVPPQLLAQANGSIRFLGVVPDAFEFVRTSAVVVVPLLSGGGIKIKTLEAMACGCPIVTTSIGAEETGARHGQHLMIADTAEAFAAHVIALLKDKALSAALGSQARALAEAKFSWPAKWQSFNDLLEHAA
jgi:polysaccharide biosynthesis protein PslH